MSELTASGVRRRSCKRRGTGCCECGLATCPATRHGQNMAKRLRKHGEAYFTFVTTPGVEPTNNLAEQAIRFVVIDRHITQGTRSEGGQRWCERIWTVIATCVQQGKSVYNFLREAVGKWFEGEPAPSLLPRSKQRLRDKGKRNGKRQGRTGEDAQDVSERVREWTQGWQSREVTEANVPHTKNQGRHSARTKPSGRVLVGFVPTPDCLRGLGGLLTPRVSHYVNGYRFFILAFT